MLIVKINAELKMEHLVMAGTIAPKSVRKSCKKRLYNSTFNVL
jgi:hypothetical protein